MGIFKRSRESVYAVCDFVISVAVLVSAGGLNLQSVQAVQGTFRLEEFAGSGVRQKRKNERS